MRNKLAVACICVMVLLSCAHSCVGANDNYKEAEKYAKSTDSLKKGKHYKNHKP